MPPEIKQIFEALRYEVAWLHAKWSLYSQLFCQGEARLIFLDSMAPGFFVIVRDSLMNELIVGLCRLTDPSTTGRRANLTLTRLAESLEAANTDPATHVVEEPGVGEEGVDQPELERLPPGHGLAGEDQAERLGEADEARQAGRAALAGIRQQFASCLVELDRTCSPLRAWRNRRLGHSDLPTALGNSPDPLPPIAWTAIDNALEEVRGLMNLLQEHYLDSEFRYEHFTDLNDGEGLVFYLEEARKFEEQEKRRALGG